MRIVIKNNHVYEGDISYTYVYAGPNVASDTNLIHKINTDTKVKLYLECENIYIFTHEGDHDRYIIHDNVIGIECLDGCVFNMDDEEPIF